MGSRRLGSSDEVDFLVREIAKVEQDLKKIKVTNFEKAFERFKKVLPQMYIEREYWNTHRIYIVSGLKCKCNVYIAKKLTVDGLRGNDHFRVVFLVIDKTITIIEVFHKSRKDIEDKNRICDVCQ
jgi:hypothetical protein